MPLSHLARHLSILFVFTAVACSTASEVDPKLCPTEPEDQRQLYKGFTPTELPVDCRCANARTEQLLCQKADAFLGLVKAAGGKRLGDGIVVADQGSAVEIRYGDYWADRGKKGEIITAVSVYTKEPGFILGVDLDTGARRVVSGRYLDPATGKKTVGAGEMFGEPGYAFRGPDNMIYVYAITDAPGVTTPSGGEIWRVDPDSGDRTLVWKHGKNNGFGQCMNGVPEVKTNPSWSNPEPMQLQLEVEGFAVGKDGSFFLTTIPNGNPAPGAALINVAKDGKTCKVVTMAPPEAGNTYPADGIGTGWDLDGYIEEVKELPDGRLLINTRTLMQVDPATGNRTRLGDAPVGEMRWDPTRNMLFITGVKNPRSPDMYFFDIAKNKTWRQIACENMKLEVGHPFTEQCISVLWGPFWSISEQQGWMTPSGKFVIWATPSTGFAIVEVATGNNMWFSF